MTSQLTAIRKASVIHIQRCKQAADPLSDAAQQIITQSLKQQALRNAGMFTLGGVGAGAGLRGIAGLIDLARRNLSAKPRKPLRRAGMIEVPIPDIDEEVEKISADNGGLLDKVIDFSKGHNATSTPGVPWAIPTMVGGAGAGLYGGWKFVDWLMNKRRTAEADEDLEQAKKEYMSALSSTMRGKQASFLGRKLDELYDFSLKVANEKQAGMAGNLAGEFAGLYGLYAGGTGLAAGVGMYNWASKRQQRAILEEALKRQYREKSERQPLPIFVSSSPKTVSQDPTDELEPEVSK